MRQSESLKSGLEDLEAVIRGRRWTILTHRNADPDAISSAVAASRLIECLGGDACILLPEGLSQQSKKLVEELQINIPHCDEAGDNVIVVDAANLVQLGSYSRLASEASTLIVMDHHATGELRDMARIAIVDPNAPASIEVLTRLLHQAGCRLEGREATLALAGLIHDSRRFQLVGRDTFRIASILVEWGGDYGRAQSLLSTGGRPPMPERVARLKAASRIRLARACREVLIAVTHIGSYESSVARSILELGADVAIVLTERREGYRVSIRVSKQAEERGIRADAIAAYLKDKYGGEGGGHPAAAMAQIPFIAPSIEEAADLIAKSVPGKIARMCVGGSG